MRATLAKTARGARAPFAAVDAIEAAIALGFDAGSARERELFADCVVSTESRASIHLFFAEREVARIPDVPEGHADASRSIAPQSSAPARWAAASRWRTRTPASRCSCATSNDAALARGMATIRTNYDATVAKGKLTRPAADRTLALITPTTTYDGFDSVDIVVEAVFEDMELKKATFAELGRVTRPDCVLASNTSTLDIDELARASGRPTQVVGHHFFSPAQRDEAARDRARARDEPVESSRRRSRWRSGSARSARSSATASASSPTGCSPTTCARRTCCSRKGRA